MPKLTATTLKTVNFIVRWSKTSWVGSNSSFWNNFRNFSSDREKVMSKNSKNMWLKSTTARAKSLESCLHMWFYRNKKRVM